jgi:hypothetical protein
MESTNNSHIEIGSLFETARLKAALDTASQSHLRDCDLCRSRLSWMETAASLGAKELEYEPPQAILDNVLKFGRGPGLLKQLKNFIVASMTFDSFTNLAPAGVRHSAAAARQFTYEADGFEIALSLQTSQPHKVILTGQVLLKDGSPIEVKSAHVDLVVEGDQIAVSSLSPWGEFVFPDLPPAAYSLRVSVLDHVVRIPALPASE